MSFFKNLFKSRKKELYNLSYDLDMDWREQDEYGLLSQLGEFKLFRQGRHKKVTNILRKADLHRDSEVCIFDYTYIAGDGKSRYRQTVFFVNAKDLNLPSFLMKPENFFHKIGQYLNLVQDIDFEAFPKFSEDYLLQGDSEDYVRDTFHNELLHFFTVEKDWCMEGMNYYLIFYRKNHRIPVDQIRNFYEKGLYVYDMLAEEG